jgi:hypothetical protein
MLETPKAFDTFMSDNSKDITMGNQQVTDFDIGWLVGILDGEGCFSLAKIKRGYSVGIKFVNTNLFIIDEVVRILTALDIPSFTYDATRAENQQPAKRVEVNGHEDVKKFIDFFYPYLLCKKDQAYLMREYIDLRATKEHGDGFGSEEYSIYCALRKT